MKTLALLTTLIAATTQTPSPERHVGLVGDHRLDLIEEVWEKILPPSEEVEYVIDQETIVLLDGKEIAFENVPMDGSVEVTELLVDQEKRRVVRIGFRTIKAANP